MTRKLNSLPPAFVAAYYRHQSDPVREALRKALGIFPVSTLNLSKENKPQITPIP